MVDIDGWMRRYQRAVLDGFGERVQFIGLQGSYGRGEQTDRSDIDVVLILDEVDIDDLELYRNLVEGLPDRELLCGFVSGKGELGRWLRSDLFQFRFDTKALYGSLEELIPALGDDDARQACLTGACEIYHACSHNFLHTDDVGILQSLFKSAFFVMQAQRYCESGVYLHHRTELLESVTGDDRQVLEVSISPSCVDIDTFTDYSSLLLAWSGRLIRRYGKGSAD